MLNSLSFCLSVKLFISPSYLNEILAGYSNLGCRLFSFITLSMSCHSLLAWRVSVERSAVILMGIPLCVIFVCPLLLLIFVHCAWFLLIWLICVLGCFARVYPVWDSLGYLDLGDYFLPHFREVFNYYLLKYFLMVFLFVFFFWDSYDSNVGAFNIVPEVSEIVLISFHSFFFFLSVSFISTILSSTSLILSSGFVILLFVPSRVFLTSFIALFLVLEKAEETDLKLSTSAGSWKKQESSRKNIYFCFIDYAKAFDCVYHNKLWKILKEMGIPDHLTCLLRNLCAGQEATVRTRHGTTDWFQIGKGVRQGYILSSCLFYIQSTSWEMLGWKKH